MTSHRSYSVLLLAGLFGVAAGTPATALTDDGRNLLERLRGRIEAKERAAAGAVETVAPPVEFKTSTPPVQEFEPGSIVSEPATEAQKQSRKKTRGKSSSERSSKKSAPGTEAKSEASMPKQSSSEESRPRKTVAKQDAGSSTPLATPASDIARTAQPTQPPADAIDAPAPAAAGSARSFGELSDAELIQYAHEHMWSKEKSRKHHPPITPPSKPKKKKDAKAVKETITNTSAKTPAKKGKS